MFYNYPHSSIQDMNLDWLLKVGKQADKDHEEWTHIKDTAQTMIDDAIQKSLDDGEIGKVVNNATTKVITEKIDPLKEQVGTNTAEITKLQKREGLFDHSGKTIIIGDSYTVGYTPEGNVTPWTTNFIKYIGLEDVTISANGGASFSTSSNSFLMLLNAVPASADVKQILVVGGFNEFGSYSEIENAINAFMGAAEARFPNAKVFSAMGTAGIVVGALFFISAIFATLTSCISVLESIAANCMEIFHSGRKKTVLVLAVIYLAASAIIALGYSVFYFEVQLPNGSAAQLLDIMDYVSNSVMMPFIALLSTILIGWVMTPDYVIDEMQRNGETFRRKKLYRVMIRYVAPVMMLVLFLQSTGILA